MGHPIRVTMLTKLFLPWIGGMELHVEQLAASLAEDGEVQVTVVTGQAGRAPAATEVRGAVRVLRARTIARIARTPITLGMRGLIRGTCPHVLHVHTPYPWGELVAPFTDRRLRVVVTYHHDVVRQRSLRRLYLPILDRLLRRADRIVTFSPDLAAASPTLRRFQEKVVVIPGGVDTARFRSSPASCRRARALRLGLAPEGHVILFVGRLVYYKGLDFLLDAMRGIEGTLLVVGQGPLERALRHRAVRLGVADRVRFLTGVGDADLPLYYQASDLLVLPSTERTETFGLVQIEAHASGIPSVCTALPTGVQHANLHEVTGLVVPPRDSDSLAAAINRLLDDAPLRETMGAAAQRRAIESFDIHRSASKVVQLYREVLGAETPFGA